MKTASFNLALIRGVRAKQPGPYNRRFSDRDIAKIRRCWEQNEGRYGLGRAIARKIGTTPSTVHWIVSGRAYK